MTNDCDAGMTLSVVAVEPKSKPTNDSSTTASEKQTTARYVSTFTTEVLANSTTTAATETSATTTLAPTKDIWTVSNPNTHTICILLSAQISVTYNDHGEVITSVVTLLLLYDKCSCQHAVNYS